eukprot:gene5859-2492_t
MKLPTISRHGLGVQVFKECFMGYLGAAILEPILSIANKETISLENCVFNLLMLFGLFSWTALLADAFDDNDVRQGFVYRAIVNEKDEDVEKFLTVKKIKDDGAIGIFLRNSCLYFQLICLVLPFFGFGNVTDTLHCYVILVLWSVMHYCSRKAIQRADWGSALVTFFFPGTILMNLEYCVGITNAEAVEDADSLK